MLRIEFYETQHRITVRLQGRFVKEFAEHARMLIGKSSEPSQFVVDLSDVTFVDAMGERVLIWLKEMGVGFTADSTYCLDICERLSLPLAATAEISCTRRSSDLLASCDSNISCARSSSLRNAIACTGSNIPGAHPQAMQGKE